MTQVIRCLFLFCVSDAIVLIIVMLFPMLAPRLQGQHITSHFINGQFGAADMRRVCVVFTATI